MLNALLISSFNSTGFNNFQFYSTGFNNFQFYLTGFNTSSFIRLVSTISSFIGLVSTISSFIGLVSTLSSFIRLVLTLPCLLTWVCLFFVLFFGTLLQEVYLLYMQYFFCLFLILVRHFVQFCSLLTKLYDIFRGNSHWPYSLTKYFTFTIV